MGVAVMRQQVPFVGHLTPQPLLMILGFSGFYTLLTNFNFELMPILTRWMPTQVIWRPMWMHYLMSSMIALNIWIGGQFSITSWLCSQGGSHSTLLSPSAFDFQFVFELFIFCNEVNLAQFTFVFQLRFGCTFFCFHYLLYL